MTLVPTCASRFLAHRRGEDGGTARRPFEAWFEPLRERYGRFLSGALARKKTVLAIAALVFVGSLGLYPLIGTELFPAVDAGQLMIRVRAPSGTRVERTEEMVRQVEDVVRESVASEDLQMLISNIGVLYDWPAAYTPNSGPPARLEIAILVSRLKRIAFERLFERSAKQLIKHEDVWLSDFGSPFGVGLQLSVGAECADG